MQGRERVKIRIWHSKEAYVVVRAASRRRRRRRRRKSWR